MKKQIAIVFGGFLLMSLLFWTACTDYDHDEVAVDTEAFWAYEGERPMVRQVQKDLMNEIEDELAFVKSLEGPAMWDRSYIFLTNDIPTMYIPVANKRQNGVRAVITARYEGSEKRFEYRLVFRKHLRDPGRTFPLKSRSAWYGFFWAMDKEFFGTNRVTPGFSRKRLSPEEANARTNGYVCNSTMTLVCIPGGSVSGDDGETWMPVAEEECELEISEECFWEDDSGDDTPCYDECDPSCIGYTGDPCYCYNNCGGNDGGYSTSDTDIFLNQNVWDTQSPYDDWNRLTDCEKDFFEEYPTFLYNAKVGRKAAETLARNKFPECDLHNDLGDALRHAYFSARNAQNMGYYNAIKLGEAHECDTPLDELNEKEMDLHNNLWGINYANSKGNFTAELFYIDFLEAYSNGKIVVLENCN